MEALSRTDRIQSLGRFAVHPAVTALITDAALARKIRHLLRHPDGPFNFPPEPFDSRTEPPVDPNWALPIVSRLSGHSFAMRQRKPDEPASEVSDCVLRFANRVHRPETALHAAPSTVPLPPELLAIPGTLDVSDSSVATNFTVEVIDGVHFFLHSSGRFFSQPSVDLAYLATLPDMARVLSDPYYYWSLTSRQQGSVTDADWIRAPKRAMALSKSRYAYIRITEDSFRREQPDGMNISGCYLLAFDLDSLHAVGVYYDGEYESSFQMVNLTPLAEGGESAAFSPA
jgi:hypothetical protein